MKLMHSNRRAALTLIEVLVVVVIIAVLGVMIIPALKDAQRHPSRINCINMVKEVTLAAKVWAGDNSDKYPMEVSITNGGTMELAITGNVVAVFQAMSNEMSTPKILCCPQDMKCRPATNFTTDFGSRNISYFVGLNATVVNPDSILMGDDNFEINGAQVKSGVLQLTTSTPIAWTSERHHFAGNVGLADGSAWPVTTAQLTNAIIKQYGYAEGFTNHFRWAVP